MSDFQNSSLFRKLIEIHLSILQEHTYALSSLGSIARLLKMLLLASYLSANRSFYKNAVLAKESKCDAFIKCITSLTNCLDTISASLALEMEGRGSLCWFFARFGHFSKTEARIHAVFFIRNKVKIKLVMFLIFSQIFYGFVS